MVPRVVLYTREGCHLCDDARAVVDQVCEEAQCEWAEIDIDANQHLADEFGLLVPVVAVDGRVVAYWEVGPEPVRAALR